MLKIDRNQTVWQRVRAQLHNLGHRGQQLDDMTSALHPYVVAERKDARDAK